MVFEAGRGRFEVPGGDVDVDGRSREVPEVQGGHGADESLQETPGTPEEIADLAVHLANATYTTGQAYAIDGGWTI